LQGFVHRKKGFADGVQGLFVQHRAHVRALLIEYRALLIECTPSAEPYFLCRVLFFVNLIGALYTIGLLIVYRALFRAHSKECRALLIECRALLIP